VERDCQLDDTQSSADMAPGSRTDVDESGANLGRQRAKLLSRKGAQIDGRLNTVENGHG
jgi:hypothetical protein